METKIENGQVVQVQTITTDLERFIETKQREVEMLQDQIKMSTDRLNTVLAELSSLIQN